ncbi:MAG: NADH-quinone oxidoreductase subunit N [Acidobacteriaceae bacterium]
MSAVSYSQLVWVTLPEIALVIAALVVLACDGTMLRGAPIARRRGVAAVIACVGSIAAMLLVGRGPESLHLADGMLVMDGQTRVVQMVLLALTLLTVLLSEAMLTPAAAGSAGEKTAFTRHIGEYFALLLFATVAVLFLVSTQNFLLIFIALEFLSLVLYILTGFDKGSRISTEAALKYFLFGGISAAILLFGISLIYGLSGSIELGQIALAAMRPDPLWMIVVVMVVVGFGFKVAAAPFHLWAPDAYQGAPTISAGFVSSSSKVASFFIFAQVLTVGVFGAAGSGVWHGSAPGWALVLTAVAAFSMVMGNLAALAQTSLRRLLAYSAIGHAGYLLLGMIAHTPQSIAALLYYVFTYALAVLGAFGVLAALEAQGIDRIADAAGLSRRAPFLAACMLIFFLSLAGIPPLAGFFGKFWLFGAALNAAPQMGLFWLVMLAILMSVVALYYYLKVLKQVYVADAAEGAGAIRSGLVTRITLGVMAVAVVVLGCDPWLLMRWIVR